MAEADPRCVVVTGASGFLGSAVTAAVTARWPEAAVVPVSRADGIDLGRAGALDGIERADVVVHAAAMIPEPGDDSRDIECWDANLAMARAVLGACRRWRPRQIVNVSSISVYPMGRAPVLAEDVVPRPDGTYGAAKLACEHLVDLAHLDGAAVAHLRLSSLYGVGQRRKSVVPLFLGLGLSGGSLSLYDGGRRTQDFLNVTDAADGIAATIAAGADGCFNLGSGVATSMAELAEAVLALPGCRGASSRVLDRPDPAPSVRVDIGRARTAFGFAPATSFTEGLRRMHDEQLAGR